MSWICASRSPAKFRSHAPATVAAVASRCWASRSSPVSWRSVRSAAATSFSVAGSAPESPCRARLQESANAVGHESSRLPRISTAKRAGAASGPRAPRHERANGGAESAEGGGEIGFARFDVKGERLRRKPGTEARGTAPGVDVAFQPADHHVLCAPAHGGAHLGGAGEAHRIEHLQEPGERARVPVVGGGGKEEAVLELRRHQAQHAAELAVFAERRRHQVVALVDDQQVPGKMWRSLRRAAGGQKLLKHVGLSQVVIRGDDAAERAPGRGVHAEPAAQALRPLAVDHLEPLRELVPQLFLPLLPQRGRREDQDPLDASAEQQLGENQARFDGLAEADVVGDEQVDPRHAQRLQERHELIALDAHAAVERARDRLPPGASVAVAGVEVGRQRRPARRPQQRVEVVCGHRAAGVRRVRQGVRFEQMATRLQLPQEALLGRRVIVGVLQVDEVESPLLAVEGLDRRDHAATVADGGEHAGAGDGAVRRRGGHGTLRGGPPPDRQTGGRPVGMIRSVSRIRSGSAAGDRDSPRAWRRATRYPSGAGSEHASIRSCSRSTSHTSRIPALA